MGPGGMAGKQALYPSPAWEASVAVAHLSPPSSSAGLSVTVFHHHSCSTCSSLGRLSGLVSASPESTAAGTEMLKGRRPRSMDVEHHKAG